MPERKGVPFNRAEWIRAAERDKALGVDDITWPTIQPAGWTATGRTLRRLICDDGKESPPSMPAELEELILRFPSAPVHGLQRLHTHHHSVGTSENFHSFRVLRAA